MKYCSTSTLPDLSTVSRSRVPTAGRRALTHIAPPLACFAVLLVLGIPSAATAQQVLASAQAGEPFGVATIEIPLAAGVPIGSQPPLRVTDAQRRVFYPVGQEIRQKLVPPSERPVPEAGQGRLLRRVGSLIREITSRDQPTEETVARRISFLFQGSEPMVVALSDTSGVIGEYQLNPESNPATHAQLLNQWWSDYTAAAKTRIDAGDYPPWVETYLVAMLSGRLHLPMPAWFTTETEAGDTLVSTLKLMAGAEQATEAMFRQAAMGQPLAPDMSRVVPVPAAPRWTQPIPNPGGANDNTAIEPLATRVPPECFYIRYGSFENYLWFRDLSEEYGGDVSRMVTLRGFRSPGTKAIETQLNLEMNQLSRMLGPTVIEDQAIIGRDLYLNDGATLGVLFKVKNAFLFRTSLQNDRATRAKSDDAIELGDTTIAGKTVSLLQSADNRVRSFMVEDGEYILVTNSETMARRFLEVGESGQSLAATSEFRLARRLMPIEREDSLFAYFSPQMLQGLVSPEYLIELRRRIDAKSDVTLVQLAKLAAAAEGAATVSIDQLIQRGYLPNNFSERSDASGIVELGDSVIDTRRGARGTFLPIADIELQNVTAEEALWYSRIAASYTSRFPHMDPIMVGVQRETVFAGGDQNATVERLAIHAEIAPWSPAQYGKYAQQLGPPTRVAMQFAPDDIVAVQAHVASEQLGPPTHLFAAIKDSVPPNPDDFDGLIKTYRALKQLPGYIGAWPSPGAIDRLPLGLGRGTPVGPGMSRLIGGIYRYTGGGFSVLSFYPDLLTASLPFLASIEVEDAAQLRGRIGNLRGSQLESWVTNQLYQRSATSSLAGADFLGMLSRQLRVPPADALAATQDIFATDLQCTLGGEYQFQPQVDQWQSTAWHGTRPPLSSPLDYAHPIMQWFRGGQFTLTQYDDRLVVDAIVDAARN